MDPRLADLLLKVGAITEEQADQLRGLLQAELEADCTYFLPKAPADGRGAHGPNPAL